MRVQAVAATLLNLCCPGGIRLTVRLSYDLLGRLSWFLHLNLISRIGQFTV